MWKQQTLQPLGASGRFVRTTSGATACTTADAALGDKVNDGEQALSYRGAAVFLAPLLQAADVAQLLRDDPGDANAGGGWGLGVAPALVAVRRWAWRIANSVLRHACCLACTWPAPCSSRGASCGSSGSKRIVMTMEATPPAAAPGGGGQGKAADGGASQLRHSVPGHSGTQQDIEHGETTGTNNNEKQASPLRSSTPVRAGALLSRFFTEANHLRPPPARLLLPPDRHTGGHYANRRHHHRAPRRSSIYRPGRLPPSEAALAAQKQRAAAAGAKLRHGLSRLSQRMTVDNPALGEILNLSNVYDMVRSIARSGVRSTYYSPQPKNS